VSVPKTGLPAGAIRLLRLCDEEAPHLLTGGDENVARVLAARGLLELLPGCTATYGTTEKGRAAIEAVS
jgi:hypothetical protein